jgi:anti-sigma regulatory factor (Ser/Thr protein kinase)
MADENHLVEEQGDAYCHMLDLTGSDARALRRVRGWIRDTLNGVRRGHIEDVTLVTDELTSNALEHGGGPRAVRVTRRSGRRQTLIEVDDLSSLGRLTVGRSRFGTEAHRGRGLRIVDALASTWGVRRMAGTLIGKTVWAEIDWAERVAAETPHPT